MAQAPPTSPMDMRDFFSAAEARTDRWRQMSAAGRAWEAAVAHGQPDERFHADAARLLSEVTALEDYWAYPGSRLMATVGEALKERNAAMFARLVQKISGALLTLRGGDDDRRAPRGPGRGTEQAAGAGVHGALRGRQHPADGLGPRDRGHVTLS
jgi:arginine decarboxylase